MKSEIFWIPETREGRLAIMPRPRSGEWLENEIKAWRNAGVGMVISLLTNMEVMELELQDEHLICQANGIEYISYLIADRQVPDSIKSTFE
jgi:hypothetical protein